MDHVAWFLIGAASLGAAIFVFEVAHKGIPWGVAKLRMWWSVGASDVAALKTDMATVKADVAALKSKIGI